jgi:uncharacterized repeat protein (TIGR03803 family)
MFGTLRFNGELEMAIRDRETCVTPGIDLWAISIAFVIALLMIVLATEVHAQTLTVLHTFTGGRDGANPMAGLTMDATGNLYGTAENGGSTGNGAVFKLKHAGSGWTLSPLYSFAGGSDGTHPLARVVFGPNGTLYGTTRQGGNTDDCTGGCGTVFNLQPQPTACTSALCPWIETMVERFEYLAFPESEVIFDSSGNIYGTTFAGGFDAAGGGNGCYPDCGGVYELVHSGSGWALDVLYSFHGDSGEDGGGPVGGLIFDNAGNLYGTTSIYGNCDFGTAFELTYSSSGWSEDQLHNFCGPAGNPAATMIADPSGNFFGTMMGSSTEKGGVFELKYSDGSWMWNSVYTFSVNNGGSAGALIMDSAGNLYGTTIEGGSNPLGQCSNGCGTIFKLTPSGGNWTYSELYDFTGGSDGAHPHSNLVMDSSGNFYGTTSQAGADNDGTVFEFTP